MTRFREHLRSASEFLRDEASEHHSESDSLGFHFLVLLKPREELVEALLGCFFDSYSVVEH